MKKAIWIIIVVVILAAAGYLIYSLSTNKTQTPVKNETTNSSSSTSNTITFDGNSFSPAKLTVTSGTTITIKNASSEDMQFDSDPHPIHTGDADLNVGAVAAGESMTFTVKKTGTFGYHDHLDPSITGTIVVE